MISQIAPILSEQITQEDLEYKINMEPGFIYIYGNINYKYTFVLLPMRTIKRLETVIEIMGIGSCENPDYPGVPAAQIVFRSKDV